jgi:hypothetical protein
MEIIIDSNSKIWNSEDQDLQRSQGSPSSDTVAFQRHEMGPCDPSPPDNELNICRSPLPQFTAGIQRPCYVEAPLTQPNVEGKQPLARV